MSAESHPIVARLLEPRFICELAGETKSEILEELCQRIAGHPHVRDSGAFRKAIIEREELVSTGIGLGLAVPHAKIPEVSDYAVVVGRCTRGVEFDALDGQPVRLVFMLAAAERQAGEFVRLLASVVRLVKDGAARLRLLEAEIPDEFLEVVREECQRS